MDALTLNQIAELTHSKIHGDPQKNITGVSDLKSAKRQHASFVASQDFYKAMLQSEAGVIFAPYNMKLPEGKDFLLNENPSRAFQTVAEHFQGLSCDRSSAFQGVHDTAVIHPSSIVEENVTIGPKAVIDRDCFIGAGTFIGAGCYIGLETRIGNDCLIHPNVTIREKTVIGNRVNLQPGVVIGGCGFGFQTDAKGNHHKISQIGIVVIEDDVEIGSNTTVCRARFGETVIGQGTKIDTLVVIGHGVKLGPNNLIVGQAGIAGSSKTGRNVVLAGHVAVKEQVELADGVIITGKSGVSKSITKAGPYGGIPAVPLKEHHRTNVHIRNLGKLFEEVKEIKLKLEKLI
ncbi:MAG: UDP-3-O-(3-hydroxymyristoyl)glucosamine N-acyltransferase [Waddliaceae bacterium]